MSDSEKVMKRKCRWCGQTFRVPRDYPKGKGCPECAPQLELGPTRDAVAEAREAARK